MTVNLSGISALGRQLASIASVVIGALGSGGLPTEVRALLIAGGALVIAVEHLVTGIGQLGKSKITTTSTAKGTTPS